MRKVTFTFNSLLLILIIFSAMFMFFTVKLTDMSDRHVTNEEYKIEGTDCMVVYNTQKPSGIYKGIGASAKLITKGSFMHDSWSSASFGDVFYCNETKITTLGQILYDVVRIDLRTGEKQTVYDNALMIGRCASGEIVCFDGYLSPYPWDAETNPFYRLYSMSSNDIRTNDYGALVTFFDAGTEKTVYTLRDVNALEEGRAEYYRSVTLGEVKK